MTRVFRHPRILTGDARRPVVQAVAVEDERIVATGTESQVRERVGPSADLVDLGGASVLPGLYDAHIHTASLAESLSAVDLRGAGSLAETLERIAAFEPTMPDGVWMTGGRWDANRWDSRAFPTREALDTVLPERPALLSSVDGHTCWANSAALRVAGIDRSTPDPPGGAFDRHPDGEPNGIVRESANALIHPHVQQAADLDLADLLEQTQEVLLSVGLTSVHDIDGEPVREAYRRLREVGRLALRVHKAIPVTALDLAIEEGRRTGAGDDWIRTGPVKLFSDGALGSHTCHLTRPFRGGTSHGLPVTDYDEMLGLVRRAHEAGIAVATHAIGDRAAELVLDAYAQVDPSGDGPLRHRIEHAQHLRPEDVRRMAEQRVVASMQPTHCTSDIDLVETLLDDGPMASYAWRDLLDAGAPLAFGSDAPVESPNPFLGLYAAITRSRPDGSPEGGWQPDQRVTIGEAIRAHTYGSAWAAGEEADKGLITEGRLADFVAVDVDPRSAAPHEIRDAQVLSTVVGGVVRWQRDAAGVTPG